MNQASTNGQLQLKSSKGSFTDSALKQYINVVDELVNTEKSFVADLLACSSVSIHF